MIALAREGIRRLLPKNQFARGVSVLVGGTAGAQAIMVLAVPFLTRLYSPADFGLLAVFTSLLSFMSVIASLRYELAIPLPEDDQDAAHLVVLGLAFTGLLALFSGIVFLFLGTNFAKFLDSPKLASYLWLLPFAVLMVGGYQNFEKWAVRTKNFTPLAKTKIVQAFSSVLIQSAGFGFGAIALLVGQVSGTAAGTTNLAFATFKREEFRNIHLGGIKNVAYRYKQFPIYSTWTALLNTASLQLAPLVFVVQFGAATAGLYALTLRVLTMPSALVGNAVGNVFLANAPEAHRNGELKELVQNLHEKLAMVGALPLAVLLLLGPELFYFAFGQEWRKAGKYAQWMAPWIYFQFQWGPFSVLSTILELQKAGLVAQLLTFVARFGSLLLCYLLSTSDDAAIMIFAVTSASVYYLIMSWFFVRIKIKLLHLLAVDFKFILISIMVVSPFWIILKAF